MTPALPTGLPDKKEIFLLFVILVAAFSLRMAFLHEPFERDEGLYAYIGQEILQGNLPYRDAMDQKPPGIHYLYAAMISLFGPTTTGIRTATACYSLLTVAAVWLCTRKVAGCRAALWGAAAYALISSGPLTRGGGSNSEVFMVLPIMAGTWLFLLWMDRRDNRLLMGSGLALGIAFFIKTVALPHLLITLLFIGIVDYGRPRRELLLRMFLFLLPSTLLLLAIGLYFNYHGALDDYYYWTVTFNKRYGATDLDNFLLRLKIGTGRVLPELLPLLVPALPGAWWLLVKSRSSHSLFVLALVPAALVGLSMPTKFFEHYFIQLVPPLAVLAGIGISFLLQQRRRLLFLTAPLLLAPLMAWSAQVYPFYLVYTPEEVSIKKYNSDVFVRALEISRFLRERTSPGEYIYQWGFEPEIYFLSGRRAPNPYTVHFAVASAPNRKAAIQSLGESIVLKKPRYIVIQEGRTQFTGYDLLKQLLLFYYTRENDVGNMQIWRRG